VEYKLELPKKILPIFQPKRFKVLYGGRGSGKSWSVARVLITKAVEKPIRILCARETQKSIQESVHRLLRDQISLMQLDHLFDVQEKKIIGKNGSEITFVGIRQQGVVNLKSYEGTDICWVEEAQVCTKKSWDILIPTIRKEGSELWTTFNPELESDPTYDRFVTNAPDNAWVCQINFNDNPFFPDTLEKERIDWKKRDPNSYETIWEGKCRPTVEGAIFHAEISEAIKEKRIRTVPYDPSLKVHTCWDLGWNDSMAIIFCQVAASEIRIIKYIEDSHRTLESYVKEIDSLDYNYGTDYLPHDASHRDFKHGRSTEEMMRSMGRDVFVLSRGDVEQGIIKARMVFPRTYFDNDEAKDLIHHLKRYKRTMNAAGEPGAPLHDASSHGADAFRYLSGAVDLMSNENWGALPKANNQWVI
jgi:phage terminase large subunit